jgi:hypothetical protein
MLYVTKVIGLSLLSKIVLLNFHPRTAETIVSYNRARGFNWLLTQNMFALISSPTVDVLETLFKA